MACLEAVGMISIDAIRCDACGGCLPRGQTTLSAELVVKSWAMSVMTEQK